MDYAVRNEFKAAHRWPTNKKANVTSNLDKWLYMIQNNIKRYARAHIQLTWALTSVMLGVIMADLICVLYYWRTDYQLLAIVDILVLGIIFLMPYVAMRRGKITPYTGPYLQRLRETIKCSGVKITFLVISESSIINASARGYGPGKMISITRPLSERPIEEANAILAHELGHHVHQDVLTSTLFGLSLLNGLAWSVVTIANLVHMRIGYFLIFSTLGALIMGMMLMAYFRWTEKRADAYAASLLPKPTDLAQALTGILECFTDQKQWTIIDCPSFFTRLFENHPPIRGRIHTYSEGAPL